MRQSYAFGIATVLIWSTMAAMVKALISNVPSLEALSVSSIFAFLFLLLVNIVTGKIKELRQYSAKRILTMAGLGFLGLFLYSALYYQGISILSSQEACILNYLWPIMLVVFSAIILKEKITGIMGCDRETKLGGHFMAGNRGACRCVSALGSRSERRGKYSSDREPCLPHSVSFIDCFRGVSERANGIKCSGRRRADCRRSPRTEPV